MVVKGKDHLMADALGHFMQGDPITSYDPLTEIAKGSQGIQFRGFESEENCCFSRRAEMVAQVLGQAELEEDIFDDPSMAYILEEIEKDEEYLELLRSVGEGVSRKELGKLKRDNPI